MCELGGWELAWVRNLQLPRITVIADLKELSLLGDDAEKIARDLEK